MELTEDTVTAYKSYTGRDRITVTAGQTLKIETTPAGEEVLNVVVPAGKQWSVGISIDITETDA